MRTLSFDNVLDSKILKEKFEQDLPHRKIQNILFEKGFQVRKSGFTTQNITVKPNPKKGIIKVSAASLDMVVIFFLFCWPLGIYILINRKKHQALEQEVIDKLNEYHVNA